MPAQRIQSTRGEAVVKVRLSALVPPGLHEQIKAQAFHNRESIGQLLERLAASAPAAAWNKQEGQE